MSIFLCLILTSSIDVILKSGHVPVSPTSDYAYINDTKEKISGKKAYYQSYQKLLQSLKEAKRAKDQTQYSDGKILNFDLFRLKDLVSVFSRLSSLEKRTVECYARLEEKLVDYTSDMLMIDEDGYPVEDFRKDLYFRGDQNYPLRFASEETYVDWNEFKEHIIDNYEYQLEENKFDMRGVYSPWDDNLYISDLGLDGLTK